jgi:hypothetical protein
VAIAMLVIGCAQHVERNAPPSVSPQPSLGEQVPLLTQQHPVPTEGPGIAVGCYTYYVNGLLVPDKTYGTAMAEQHSPTIEGPPRPIMWPFGYTGYRVGSGVALVDEQGRAVGITGTRYWLTMAGIDPTQPNVPDKVFAACGPPRPWTPESEIAK